MLKMINKLISLHLFLLICIFAAGQNPKSKIIEKYVWKGKCEDTTGGMTGVYKLIICIYSDSTFAFYGKECRYGRQKNEWKEKNKQICYGVWSIREFKRIYYQNGIEITSIQQKDDYILYFGRKLNRKRKIK